jgi:hypothetical protein
MFFLFYYICLNRNYLLPNSKVLKLYKSYNRKCGIIFLEVGFYLFPCVIKITKAIDGSHSYDILMTLYLTQILFKKNKTSIT